MEKVALVISLLALGGCEDAASYPVTPAPAVTHQRLIIAPQPVRKKIEKARETVRELKLLLDSRPRSIPPVIGESDVRSTLSWMQWCRSRTAAAAHDQWRGRPTGLPVRGAVLCLWWGWC